MTVPRALLLSLAALALSGCYYPPAGPVMSQSYQFDKHPGVYMETWTQYDYYGVGYPSTIVINRSNMPKCAWTEALDSRLLRPGESWKVSQGNSPGNIGVSNVIPTDPDCVNAKRDYH